MRPDKFHGRCESGGRFCDRPGCDELGEFRAPGHLPSGFDGPGDYHWFCLDHVRQFNAGFDFFEGMSSEEIQRAQSPLSGWDNETRAFRATAEIDSVPRWADFADPLDAIGKRARRFRNTAEAANQSQTRSDGRPLTGDERRALDELGLPIDADRKALRNRYAKMLRRFHPDHNGGNRSHEARLRAVVDAYQLLRKADAFR